VRTGPLATIPGNKSGSQPQGHDDYRRNDARRPRLAGVAGLSARGFSPASCSSCLRVPGPRRSLAAHSVGYIHAANLLRSASCQGGIKLLRFMMYRRRKWYRTTRRQIAGSLLRRTRGPVGAPGDTRRSVLPRRLSRDTRRTNGVERLGFTARDAGGIAIAPLEPPASADDPVALTVGRMSSRSGGHLNPGMMSARGSLRIADHRVDVLRRAAVPTPVRAGQFARLCRRAVAAEQE